MFKNSVCGFLVNEFLNDTLYKVSKIIFSISIRKDQKAHMTIKNRNEINPESQKPRKKCHNY